MQRIWKRKEIIILAVIALLTTAGTTLAYYSQNQNVDNVFSTKAPEMQIAERFNKQDRWLPGEEKQKEVKFKNSGQIPTLLRFKIEVDVKDSKVETGDITLWAHGSFPNYWSPQGQISGSERMILEPETWYYYNQIFAPDEVTNITLQSVSFSKTLSNDWEHDMDVSGKNIDIKIKAEMVQVNENAVLTLYGRTYEITDGKKVAWK